MKVKYKRTVLRELPNAEYTTIFRFCFAQTQRNNPKINQTCSGITFRNRLSNRAIISDSRSINDPYAIRTHYLPLRRRPLYPAELMDHASMILKKNICFKFYNFPKSRRLRLLKFATEFIFRF